MLNRRVFLTQASVLAMLSQVPSAFGQSQSAELNWSEGPPSVLDPHIVFDGPMVFYMLNTYDTLYRYSGNPPKIVPWLANEYTASPDGLSWTFKLRPGSKFQDGSEITAEDVVYSFKRLLALNRGPAAVFRPILESVSASDKHTVQFKLKVPYAPFLSTVPLVAIVNPRVIAPNVKDNDWGSAWLSANSAGSGPYMVDTKTYRPLEALDFRRFEDHFAGWGHNPKPVSLIRNRYILETTTRVSALMRGDIDAIDHYLPVDQLERIGRTKGLRVTSDETMRVFVITIHNQRAPLDNVHFRRALSHAFNYKGFIDGILRKGAVRNPGPIPQNLWGSPADVKGYEYSLEMAKAELEKARAAGAPVDREIEIHTQNQQAQTTQAAQVFQADLRKIGINLKIVPNLWPPLAAAATKAETSPDMWVHWVSAYFIDPENWIGQMYDSSFHGTWKGSAWYKNDKVDQLLREARRELDQDRRRSLYEQASRIVVEDAADIWVYNTIQMRGLSQRIKGFEFSPVGGGSEFRILSLS
jgi:peptide/nickel transport system substrate-binding protein